MSATKSAELSSEAGPAQSCTDRFSPSQCAAILSECAHCGSPGVTSATTDAPPKLQICGRCRKVAYCGVACQRAAWKAGHKRVCKAASTNAVAKPKLPTPAELDAAGLTVCVECRAAKPTDGFSKRALARMTTKVLGFTVLGARCKACVEAESENCGISPTDIETNDFAAAVCGKASRSVASMVRLLKSFVTETNFWLVCTRRYSVDNTRFRMLLYAM